MYIISVESEIHYNTESNQSTKGIKMKIQVTESVFVDYMTSNSRTKDNFSYSALQALFDWYEGTGVDEDTELNPVDIDMQWSDLSPTEIINDYKCLVDSDELEELEERNEDEEWTEEQYTNELLELVIEEINGRSTAIALDNGNYVLDTQF